MVGAPADNVVSEMSNTTLRWWHALKNAGAGSSCMWLCLARDRPVQAGARDRFAGGGSAVWNRSAWENVDHENSAADLGSADHWRTPLPAANGALYS